MKVNTKYAEKKLNAMQRRIDKLRAIHSEDARFETGEAFRNYAKALEDAGYIVTHNARFEWHVRKGE